MPCPNRNTNPCEGQPIYTEVNLCKDVELPSLILPTINGQRITLNCNECYLHKPEVLTDILCVEVEGFCLPPCRNLVETP